MKIFRDAGLLKTHLMFMSIVLGGLFFLSFQVTIGQTTTFAQFTQNPAGQNFVFTNNTPTNATFRTTPTTGVQVNFNYSNIANLNAALTGTQSAKLFITTTTTTASVGSFGVFLAQPLNQSITISIIRDTPGPVGSGTRTNLLTAVISAGNASPSISGQVGGTSGNFSAATTNGNQNVTFTSDFVTFNNTSQRDLAIAFSSIQPSLAISGDYLQSFTASGTGTFASNPAPLVSGPPTAATVAVSGRVINTKGRGLSNAQVIVTQSDGSTQTVLTDDSGYYSFENIMIPQTVIFSVAAKNYVFNPQIVTLNTDLSQMVFTSNN